MCDLGLNLGSAIGSRSAVVRLAWAVPQVKKIKSRTVETSASASPTPDRDRKPRHRNAVEPNRTGR